MDDEKEGAKDEMRNMEMDDERGNEAKGWT